MESTTMVVVILMGAALVAAVLLRQVLMRSFRRIVTVESPQPFGRMMTQCGLSPDDAAGREYDLVVAVTRCANCKSVEECHTLLEVGRGRAAKDFCRNAPFLGELAARAPHADSVFLLNA